MSRLIRVLATTPALLAVMCCVSCGNSKSRRPTAPVEGKVFWKNEKTPATHAFVVFRPIADDKPENWPEGFPRGRVGADGSFKLTTYTDNDGAPAGEYAVLIQWPAAGGKPAQEDSDPEAGDSGEDSDRLQGAYSDAAQPRWKKQVKDRDNDPKDFVFVLR